MGTMNGKIQSVEVAIDDAKQRDADSTIARQSLRSDLTAVNSTVVALSTLLQAEAGPSVYGAWCHLLCGWCFANLLCDWF